MKKYELQPGNYILIALFIIPSLSCIQNFKMCKNELKRRMTMYKFLL